MTMTMSPERLARLVGDFDRSPAYLGLLAALRELIGDGRIPVGTRLPSERSAAPALGVSRTTVTRAYADLVACGFATARQGSGTFAATPLDRQGALDRVLRPMGATIASAPAIDLTCATRSAVPGVARAFEQALEALPAYLSGDGYLPSGLPDLQAQIADRYDRRGLPTTPEQIVVTTGALSATAIAARALSRRGDRIMVESPVYANAVETLRLGGGRLVSSPLADPLGDSGWDLDGIAGTLRQASPRLAYLIPDFQNPTGFLMSDEEREAYATALRDAGTTALVDETMQPTAHENIPMPAPFGAHHDDTITIGSVSKEFWGGLRVGWIRAPLSMVPALVAARVQIDLGSSLFDQLVVAELLRSHPDGMAGRREHLRAQRDALVDALREHLPEWRFRVPTGGLALWVQLHSGSATRLSAAAEKLGVVTAPGPLFTVEGGADSWLRLPFTRPLPDLESAVLKLAEAAPAAEEPEDRHGRARILIA